MVVSWYNENTSRSVVSIICTRMEPGQPLFLIGYSLGGNVVSKYLGEECLSGTLQKDIRGGICISSPAKLRFDANASWKPFEEAIKGQLAQHWNEYSQVRCTNFQSALEKAIRPCSTIQDVYSNMATHLIRNDPQYPHSTLVGYKDVDHLLRWKWISLYQTCHHPVTCGHIQR